MMNCFQTLLSISTCAGATLGNLYALLRVGNAQTGQRYLAQLDKNAAVGRCRLTLGLPRLVSALAAKL